MQITGEGAEALAYAVLEMAVKDYKSLVDAGGIVDNQCADPWPMTAKGKPKKVVLFYDRPMKVSHLLHFWSIGGPAEMLLSSLNNTIHFDAIYDKLRAYRPGDDAQRKEQND